MSSSLARIAALMQEQKKPGSLAAGAKRAARKTERARIDVHFAKVRKGKPTPKKKLKYPIGVSLAGQGFRDLYDVVGGRKSTPEQLKRKSIKRK